MKKIYLILLIFLFANIVEAKELVEYESCVDGDTIWIKMNDKSTKVRLLSINAPEIEHEESPADYMGEESKNYVCNILENATKVEMEYDKNSKKEDKYGRTLAWIWVDDKLLQESIIEEGLAKVDYVYNEYEYSAYLCEVEYKAIDAKKGIWQKDKKIGYCKNKKLAKEEVEETTPSEEDIIITDTTIYISVAVLFFLILLSVIIYIKKN